MTVTYSTRTQPQPQQPLDQQLFFSEYDVSAAPTAYDSQYDDLYATMTAPYYTAAAPAEADPLLISAAHNLEPGNATALYLPPPPPQPPSSSSSSNSSSSTSTPSSRRRYRRVAAVDPRVQRERNVKHNEAEIRRRQRLNGILSELAVVVGCERPYKSASLRAALDRLKTLEARVHEANSRVQDAPSTSPSAVSSVVNSGDVRCADVSSDSLLSASCVAMHMTDLNGRIVDCNHLFASFLGYGRDTLTDGAATLLNILSPHSLTDYFAVNTRLITNRHSVQRAEYIYHSAHGLRAAAVMSWMHMHAHSNTSVVVSLITPIKSPH
jgi:PAS domain S-box-containing protein